MQNPNYVQYPRFQDRRVRFEALGEAFSWFGRDWKLYVVAALPFFLLMVVFFGFVFSQAFSEALRGGRQDPFSGSFFLQQAGGIMIGFVQQIALAGIVRLAILRLDGKAATPFSGYQGLPWGSLIGAGLVVYLLTTVGTYLCCLPGFLAGGLLMVTYPLITEQRLGAIDAIGRSFDAVKPSMWVAAGLFFVTQMVMGFSAVLCGIGLLAGYPIMAITIAIVYRDLFPANPEWNAAPPVGY